MNVAVEMVGLGKEFVGARRVGTFTGGFGRGATMAAPTDPQAAPDSPSPSALRRPLLTITGLSLLSLGAFANADRLGLDRSEDFMLSDMKAEEPPPEELESSPEGGS